MRITTLLALLVGVMLYLVMGALVFSTLEASKENLVYKQLVQTKHTFLANHSCVNEMDFHRLVEGVASALEAGLDVSSITVNFTSRWDPPSAFFFCGTIITTIGFGNLSPRTWYGQLFCVCYALVGIPMFGILLAGVGDHMGTGLRKAVAKIETLFLKRKVQPTTVRVISAVLSILIGCLIFLAVPTVVFQKVEEWSFLEAIYFVVITLTTVGFGDFVPGGNQAGFFFKPLVWLWIVFGLAYFASILTMIGDWLRVLSKRTRAEMEELRAHATDWTQNIQNMSMDFRIPNPLEFNDPFLLQRRRWKRSERRRIRRGAHGTLGHWVRAGSENGHLPNRWAGLSSSMGQLEGHSSLERAAGASEPRPRGTRGGGAEARTGAGPVLRAEPLLITQAESRILSRSFSLPAARSASELDSPCAGEPGGSLSGSDSQFDSRSDGSSLSSSFFAALPSFQPCRAGVYAERTAIANSPQMNKPTQEPRTHTPAIAPAPSPSPPPSSLSDRAPPSPVMAAATAASSPPSCQLLDFFGENLAYIDESSDTLSDRVQDEKRRRPRKPKRRSVRGRVPHRGSPLLVRRQNSDSQPPSNPPTPPPTHTLVPETHAQAAL